MTSRKVSRKSLVLILACCFTLVAVASALTATLLLGNAYADEYDVIWTASIDAGDQAASDGHLLLTEQDFVQGSTKTFTVKYSITASGNGVAGMQDVKITFNSDLFEIEGKIAVANIGNMTYQISGGDIEADKTILWSGDDTNYTGTTNDVITVTFRTKALGESSESTLKGATFSVGHQNFGLETGKCIYTVKFDENGIAGQTKDCAVYVNEVNADLKKTASISIEDNQEVEYILGKQIKAADTSALPGDAATPEMDQVTRFGSQYYIKYTYSAYEEEPQNIVLKWNGSNSPSDSFSGSTGSYKLKISAAESDNYVAVAEQEVTFKINPFKLVVSASDFTAVDKQYTGSYQNWEEEGNVTLTNSFLNGKISVDEIKGEAIDVGSVNLTVKVSILFTAFYTFGGDSGSSFDVENVSAQITKADLQTSASNGVDLTASWIRDNIQLKPHTYNAATQTFAQSDISNWDEFWTDKVTATIVAAEGSEGNHKDAGSNHKYTVTFTLTDAAAKNYQFAGVEGASISGDVDATISPYAITVEPQEQQVIYDGSSYASRISQGSQWYTISVDDGEVASFVADQIGSGDLVVTVIADPSESGNWTSKASYDLSIELSGESGKNYSLTVKNGAGKFIIGNKQVEAPATTFKYTYSGELQGPDGNFGDYKIVAEKQTEVGSYTFTAQLNDKENTEWADTHDTIDKSGNWYIEALEITVTLPNGTFQFTDATEDAVKRALTSGEIKFSPEREDLSADTFIPALDLSAVTNATGIGTYYVTVQEENTFTNYTFKVVEGSGKFDITVKTINIGDITFDMANLPGGEGDITSYAYQEYTGDPIDWASHITFTSSQQFQGEWTFEQIVRMTDTSSFVDANGYVKDTKWYAYEDEHKNSYSVTYELIDSANFVFSGDTKTIELFIYRASNALDNSRQGTVSKSTTDAGDPTIDYPYDKYGNQVNFLGVYTSPERSEGNRHNGKYTRGVTYYAFFSLDATHNRDGIAEFYRTFEIITSISAPKVETTGGQTLVASATAISSDYDGKPQILINGVSVSLTSEDTFEGFTVTIERTYSINNQSSSENPAECKNAGTYEIKIYRSVGYTWEGSGELTFNFIISQLTLDVTPGTATIMQKDPFPADFPVTAEGWADGEDESTYEITSWEPYLTCFYNPANSAANNYTVLVNKTALETQLNANYSVNEVDQGNLTVTKFAMRLQGFEFLSGELVYNGEERSIITVSGTVSNIQGEGTEIKVFGSTKPATDYEEVNRSNWQELGSIRNMPENMGGLQINVNWTDWKVKNAVNSATDGKYYLVLVEWDGDSQMQSPDNQPLIVEVEINIAKYTVYAKANDHTHELGQGNCTLEETFDGFYTLTTDGISGQVGDFVATELQFTVVMANTDTSPIMKISCNAKEGFDINNYDIHLQDGSLTIIKVDNSWTTASKDNGDIESDIWVKLDRLFRNNAFVEGEDFFATAQYGKVQYTITGTGSSILDVGSYTIKAFVPGNEFYNDIETERTIQITPATLTVKGIEFNQTAAQAYNGQEQEFVIGSITLETNNGQTVSQPERFITVSYEGVSKPVDADTYNVTLTFNLGELAQNYVLAVENQQVQDGNTVQTTFKIEKATLTLTFTYGVEQEYDYTGEPTPFNPAYSISTDPTYGGSGDLEKLITEIYAEYPDLSDAPTDAGEHRVTLHFDWGETLSKNYNFVVTGAQLKEDNTVDTTLTIKKVSLKLSGVTLEQETTYNGAEQSFDISGATFTLDGGQTISATLEVKYNGDAQVPKNADEYNVTLALIGDLAKNYDLTSDDGEVAEGIVKAKFTIKKAALTVTLDSVIYREESYKGEEFTLSGVGIMQLMGGSGAGVVMESYPEGVTYSVIYLDLIGSESAPKYVKDSKDTPGTYRVTLTFNLGSYATNYYVSKVSDGSINETATENAVTVDFIKITAVALTVSPKESTSVYGDPLVYQYEITIGQLFGEDTIEVSFTPWDQLRENAPVGYYQFLIDSASCPAGADYENSYKITAAFAFGDYTITKADTSVSITINDGDLQYMDDVETGEGKNIVPKAVAKVESDLFAAETFTYEFKAPNQSDYKSLEEWKLSMNGYLDAGTWTVRVTFTGNSNYNAAASVEETFEISPRQVDQVGSDMFGLTYPQGDMVQWQDVEKADGQYIPEGYQVMYRIGEAGELFSDTWFYAKQAGAFEIYAVVVDAGTKNESKNFAVSIAATTKSALTVTFQIDSIDATVPENWPEKVYIFYGEKAILPEADYQEFKGEQYVYRFKEWTKNGETAEPETTRIENEVTFIATYNRYERNHTVTYYVIYGDKEDRTENYVQIKQVELEYEQLVTLDFASITELKEVKWFRFDGWYTDEGRKEAAVPGMKMDTENISLYAIYVFDVGIGDVNGDGSIGTDDITMYRQMVVGGWGIQEIGSVAEAWTTAYAEGFDFNDGKTYFLVPVADIMGDGSTDIRDITQISMAKTEGYGLEVVESGYNGLTGATIVESAKKNAESANAALQSDDNAQVAAISADAAEATATNSSEAAAEVTEEARRSRMARKASRKLAC